MVHRGGKAQTRVAAEGWQGAGVGWWRGVAGGRRWWVVWAAGQEVLLAWQPHLGGHPLMSSSTRCCLHTALPLVTSGAV